MKNHIVLIAFILSLFSCNTGKTQKDKQVEMSSKTSSQLHGQNSNMANNSLANLQISELNAINRNLTAIARDNFRSWSYNEPDRWKYLSEKFADEVISSFPEAETKRAEISNIFIKHLSQRTNIYNSNAKNKQELMSKLSLEFKYNLSFLIGIEGYQKWQSLSKNELQKFELIKDSLNKIIAYSYTKNQKTKLKTHD